MPRPRLLAWSGVRGDAQDARSGVRHGAQDVPYDVRSGVTERSYRSRRWWKLQRSANTPSHEQTRRAGCVVVFMDSHRQSLAGPFGVSEGIWLGTPFNLNLERESRELERRMPEIRHPHLVLWGEKDGWIAPADLRTMALAMPDCRLVSGYRTFNESRIAGSLRRLFRRLVWKPDRSGVKRRPGPPPKAPIRPIVAGSTERSAAGFGRGSRA
jgi:pimeloyl-ACP methyl ester carboxylesterase